MSLNNLPSCIIKYILNFTDILTTIKFSMVSKKYYNYCYPSIKQIREIASGIINLKNVKYRKISHKNFFIGIMCDVCKKTSFNNINCSGCKMVCCNSCFFNNNCACYKCDKCGNSANIIKNERCTVCNCSFCANCIGNNYIEYKHGEHIICTTCIILSYYCSNCKTKKCLYCISKFGDMCIECKNLKK